MSVIESLPLSAPWLRLLSSEQMDRVQRDLQTSFQPAGSVAARKGEPVDAWLGVLSGLVKISAMSTDGKAMTFTGVPAGGWFGEGSLLKRDEPRRYDVIALRDSWVARLPADTFQWLLDSSVPFNQFLLRQFNERLSQFIGMVEYERLLDPDARLARCLAELFNPVLYPGLGRRLEISQEEIGYLAGVSRQRVNQALQALDRAGLLKVEYGAVVVHDLAGLKTYGG